MVEDDSRAAGKEAAHTERLSDNLTEDMRHAAQNEAFRCLDCAKVTLRSPKLAYECPICGSLDSIVVGEEENGSA